MKTTEMPLTKSMNTLRPLGSLEHLFWLLDSHYPMHFMVIADVSNATVDDDWTGALEAVQRRHPLLRASIVINESGMPEFREDRNAKIALRVITDAQERWESEVAREKLIRFDCSTAPLMRCVLVPREGGVTVILSTHHSIADATGIMFVLRDILKTMSGDILVPLALPTHEETLISNLPPSAMKVGQSTQIQQAPDTATSIYRQDGAAIQVQQRCLSVDRTSSIRIRARAEDTTVHGAICAALVTAGRSSIWKDKVVRVFSPVNLRPLLGVGDDCVLCIGGGTRATFPSDAQGFWNLARFATRAGADQKTPEAAIAAKNIWEMIATRDLTVEAAAALAASAFVRDTMISNLGAVPFDTKVGRFTIETLWGPVTVGGVEGEFNIGAVTTNGALSLILTNYDEAGTLLEDAEAALRSACAGA